MNFNVKMLEILSKNKEMGIIPKILLHSCCAPCSSHVISVLTEYFDITIYYYNPNIEPYEEYLKRKNEEINFIKKYPSVNKLDIIDCDYDNDKFREISKGLEMEPERGARCNKCFFLRLDKTASVAKDLGYDYFGTTLTVSPYKNSDKLNEIGDYLSRKYNIKFLYSDFKKNNGYRHSIELSREYNLYRQDYCGCVFSKRDRDLQKKAKIIES